MKNRAAIAVFCVAFICTICTLIFGIGAFLAVTGLDLLVMAKKSLPWITLGFAVASLVLWITGIIFWRMHKKEKEGSGE